MEIPVKLLVKLRRFFFGRTVRPSMDVPQEETLELPGGRKQVPTLQGFWWLVMVLVKKQKLRNLKINFFGLKNTEPQKLGFF